MKIHWDIVHNSWIQDGIRLFESIELSFDDLDLKIVFFFLRMMAMEEEK